MAKTNNNYKPYNGYKTMWILATFDLPTLEKDERRRYSRFRNLLLSNGFNQLQYSVYSKYFPSFQQGLAMAKHLKAHVPSGGSVMLFYFTDKQFGMTDNLFGKQEVYNPHMQQQQLEFF